MAWMLGACAPTTGTEAPDGPRASTDPTAAAVRVAAEPAAPVEPTTAARGRCAEVIDFAAHLAPTKVSATDLATARKVLRGPGAPGSGSVDEQHAAELSARVAEPMAVLANLLTDPEVGDAAASVMFAIDADAAAPVVFASMPRSDRNVQFHSFKLFLRAALGPTPPCWDAVVRDGARRTLETGTNADAAEQALLALGVSGSGDDTMLLRRYLASTESVDVWRERLADAAGAALARIGDPTAIAALRVELDVPVARSLDFDGAVALVRTLDKAGFSRQRQLAPLVCRQLGAPPAAPRGHMLPPQPARHAAMALGHIVDGKAPDDPEADVDAWIVRCRSL